MLATCIAQIFMPESSGYISFDQNFFFQLVQLKWDLFQLVFSETDADFLVYLDLDVVVLKDLITEFERTFNSSPNVEVLVQDFTHLPSVPRLCMGIFAVKRGSFSNLLFQKCSVIHSETLTTKPRFGDDDVITQVYADLEFKNSIFLLPQHSFPVGNLINLFLPFSPLRGLRPERPFVFHSNFVVGFEKKHLLLEMMYEQTRTARYWRVIKAYFIVSRSFIWKKSKSFFKKSVWGLRRV